MVVGRPSRIIFSFSAFFCLSAPSALSFNFHITIWRIISISVRLLFYFVGDYRFRAKSRSSRMTSEGGWSNRLGEKTPTADRKSTRLNSSHVAISYAVFCLKKKKAIETMAAAAKTDESRAYSTRERYV